MKELLIILTVALAACSPADATAARAKNAIDLAGYQSALDDCRAQGKAAHSYDVYEACAQKADTKFGLDGGVR